MTLSSVSTFIDKQVPFFGNTDGRLCGPCVYQMMLKYFQQDQDYSIEQVKALCAAVPGKNTWLFAVACNLADLGYDVTIISDYDFRAMRDDVEGYLIARNGPESARKSIENNDMESLPHQISTFLDYVAANKIGYLQQCWTKNDMIQFLDDGYLACAWVNYYALREQDGNAGHFILCYDYDDQNFLIHDPGNKTPDSYMIGKSIPADLLIKAASPRIIGQTESLILIKPHTKV